MNGKMKNKHNFIEYAYAKELVKNFPIIEKKLDNLYKDLYHQQCYLAVQHILDSIADSKRIMKRQYDYYSKVVARKGLDE